MSLVVFELMTGPQVSWCEQPVVRQSAPGEGEAEGEAVAETDEEADMEGETEAEGSVPLKEQM